MAWQRKTPFGYMVRGGETVSCPLEAEAVQNIFKRYLAGASYGQIAEEMSRGNIPYHQHTAQWNKHMVKRILENGRYQCSFAAYPADSNPAYQRPTASTLSGRPLAAFPASENKPAHPHPHRI